MPTCERRANKLTLKFDKTKGGVIRPSQIVQVKRMNHIVEVRCVERKSAALNKFRKISKTEYVDIDTGEIGEYRIAVDRSESLESLAHTFRSIRELINNGFVGNRNELMHTMTYKENMTDNKRLYSDFKAFWKRYKRRYGNNIDYISIVEPQERGAWHMHVLVRHNDKDVVYIPNDDVAEIWGHGWTKTRSINNIDNIGAYLSAYLANVEFTKENAFEHISKKSEIILKEIDGQQKAFVKGARLKMYPPGMNIYRCSRGIRRPKVETMTYKEAKKIVGVVAPNHSSTVTIHDDGRHLNTITYEQYNLKRAEVTEVTFTRGVPSL